MEWRSWTYGSLFVTLTHPSRERWLPTRPDFLRNANAEVWWICESVEAFFGIPMKCNHDLNFSNILRNVLFVESILMKTWFYILVGFLFTIILFPGPTNSSHNCPNVCEKEGFKALEVSGFMIGNLKPSSVSVYPHLQTISELDSHQEDTNHQRWGKLQ